PQYSQTGPSNNKQSTDRGGTLAMAGVDTFGGFVRSKRLAQRITLRSFCEMVGVDPANYSKVERGVLSPPRDVEKLEAYERTLGIIAGSPDSRELRRLAALDRGELPPAVLANSELLRKLPALFRTLEGEPIDDRRLEELAETIHRE